jgi:hypothetical protein
VHPSELYLKEAIQLLIRTRRPQGERGVMPLLPSDWIYDD